MRRRVAIAVGGLMLAAGLATPILGQLAQPAKPAALAPMPAIAKTDTAMADRIATVGILNKRNGLSRDLRLHPGQAVRIGDLVVRVKACDATADWEAEKLTGTFVQVIVRGADNRWRKHFSGWLFKETPSLNVVEHPIYDVWAKDCTMRHADVGPGTVTLSGDGSDKDGAGVSSSSPRRSSARKSPSRPATAPAPNDAPSVAAPSNAT